MKQVAIIHYNTPELTQAAIMSLRKHGGGEYAVMVFDNSDKRPFMAKMPGVSVVDNTKGQFVDFDKELAKFPHKNRSIGCARGNEWGSDKHMMSVQKLWELLPDGFVLMDSDILIRKPIDTFFRKEYSVVGYVQRRQTGKSRVRVMPMLCWMNVPMFRKEGVNYFDPDRSWGLKADTRDPGNWYDTGASLLEDIMSHRPRLKGMHMDIRPFLLHYGSASWRNGDVKNHIAWLQNNIGLWKPRQYRTESDKIALCAIGRMENRYAKEWVDHHLSLGFDKIYIYDNNFDGEEKFEDVLKKYIDNGKVEIIDWRNREHQQNQSYFDYYTNHGWDYAWTAFFDFDEFLHLEGNLKDVLDGIRGDVAKVNWECYGDNGLIKKGRKKVAARFTKPISKDVRVKAKEGDNHLVKSFVRGGMPYAVWNNPHCPRVPGIYSYIDRSREASYHPVRKPDYRVGKLKHYVTKTIEEWMTNKVPRGEGSRKENSEELQKNAVSIFFKYNERTPEKEAWLRENGYLE